MIENLTGKKRKNVIQVTLKQDALWFDLDENLEIGYL